MLRQKLKKIYEEIARSQGQDVKSDSKDAASDDLGPRMRMVKAGDYESFTTEVAPTVMKEIKELAAFAKDLELKKSAHDWTIREHLDASQVAEIEAPESINARWEKFNKLYEDAAKDPVKYFRTFFQENWDQEEEARKREMSS